MMTLAVTLLVITTLANMAVFPYLRRASPESAYKRTVELQREQIKKLDRKNRVIEQENTDLRILNRAISGANVKAMVQQRDSDIEHRVLATALRHAMQGDEDAAWAVLTELYEVRKP